MVNILSKFIEKSIDINDKYNKNIIKKIGYSEFYKNDNIFKKNYRNYLS